MQGLINRQAWSQQKHLAISRRLLSFKDRKPSNQRQKRLKLGHNKVDQPSQDLAVPSVSELLKNFLTNRSPRVKSSHTTKGNATSEVEVHTVTSEAKGVFVQDVIKSRDLLRDFLHINDQKRKTLRAQARVRHSEQLPRPYTFRLFDKAIMKGAGPSTTNDTNGYQNDVFDSIDAIESSLYRTRPTHKFNDLLQLTINEKIWKYPIDNEQDWQEIHTPFNEHVFLRRFIGKSKQYPTPLRAFMELVCAGLGQNPYISAQEKLDHVAWFDGYFASKVEHIQAAVEEEKRLANAEEHSRRNVKIYS